MLLHGALHTARSVLTAFSKRSSTSRNKPIKLEVCVDLGRIKNVHKTRCTSIVVVRMCKVVGTRTAPRDIAITIAKGQDTLCDSPIVFPRRHKRRAKAFSLLSWERYLFHSAEQTVFHSICLEHLLDCFHPIDAARHDVSTQWEVSAKDLERRHCGVQKHEHRSRVKSF